MFTQTLPKLHVTAADCERRGYLADIGRHVRTALCALHGHDFWLHFYRGRRVCLRCANCGYETPGWSAK